MRKLFVIFVLFILSHPVFADIGRSTSFDDRDVCEKTKGVWREFGNSLGDNCEAKFDQFSIAAQVLTYACDCGKSKCWNGDKCVAMLDYKKVFDQKQEAERAKMAEAKKARHQAYQNNSSAIIQAMVSKTAVATDTGSVAGNNNVSQFYDKLMPGSSVPALSAAVAPIADNVNQQTQQFINQGGDAVRQVQEGPLGKVFSVPKKENPIVQDPSAANAPATPADDAQNAGPTPFFLQQQEKAKQAADAAAKAVSPTIQNPNATVIMDAPGLPQIPLPQ